MSVLDIPRLNEPQRCPTCGGAGQVYIGGEPKFCKPCEGTGWVVPDSED